MVLVDKVISVTEASDSDVTLIEHTICEIEQKKKIKGGQKNFLKGL